jgi:hypothetical protein
MLDLGASLLKQFPVIHEAHRRSTLNLAHYLELRQHDLRHYNPNSPFSASPLLAAQRVMF